jgi:hypothetical protein
MNSHVLVCDFDEELISRLHHRNLVLRMNAPDLITHAVKVVQEKNSLYAIWLHGDLPLSKLDVTELEKSNKMQFYLEVTGLGDFRDSIGNIRSLRKLDVLVILAEDAPGTYRDLKILSSLFVPCGISFRNQQPNWESLADLMAYSIYNNPPHAPIEPFHFVISNYDPLKRIDFGSVYFEDPCRFLHIDTRGRIALSREEMERESFLSSDLEALDRVNGFPSYIQRTEAWREFFLKPDGCAYCPGWQICLGKFAGTEDKESGCMKFFGELMEAVDHCYERKKPKDI